MDMDIEHLRGWIGREDKAQELLTEELVRRFRATLGLADTTTPPRLIHLCLAPPVVPNAATGPDGHPARGGFLPPIPLPNRMWAGGDFTFHGDPQVGELITRHSSIRDVVLKSGRSGPLCFVTVDHRISAGGRRLVEERQDIVYRAASPRAAPAEAAAPGAYREDADGAPLVLFRYSALPFNGHRIHYDHPYATQVEGYPGLVVHGPLQATWLYHYAARLRNGAPPARFGFRSHAPLFDSDRITLNARERAEGLTLWTAAANGPVAMLAEADW